ncbi:type VI secretion system domain-containing protein [Vibrio sp. WXL210]|uniref:type VI secretion system domain-containing protein n=1 Tax=Vibrio sp. WXL210 TaxID=3450709 RepID=UPI003EC67293
MNNIELYTQPISAEAPAGIDAQYETCFELMEAEVKKFGSLFGETVNWQVVAENAQELLAEHSKDLKALCYLTRAWYEIHQLPGLNAALKVFIASLECAGSEVFPSRPRRRDGAVEWLNKHSELMLSGVEFTWNDKPELEQAALHASQLCDLYFELFDRAEVSLVGTRNAIQDKLQFVELNCAPSQSEPVATVEETPQSQQTEAVESPVNQQVSEKSIGQSEPTPEPKVPVQVEEPVTVPATEAKSEKTQEVKTPKVAVETSPQADSLQSTPSFEPKTIADLDELVRQLTNGARSMLAADPSNLTVYAVNRFVTWSGIDALPGHNSDKVTELRLPIAEALLDEITQSISSNSADLVLIQRVENSLVNAPFWLTGQYLLSQLLNNAGFNAAAQVVKLATQQFVERMPGISELYFADNQAYCDESTLQWVNEAVTRSTNSAVSNSAPPAPIDMDGFEHQALDESNFAEVMFKAAALLADANSGREKFIVHLQLAQMLYDANLPHLSWPYIETIAPIRKEVNLELWEPQLSHQYDALKRAILLSQYGEPDSVPEQYRSWVKD